MQGNVMGETEETLLWPKEGLTGKSLVSILAIETGGGGLTKVQQAVGEVCTAGSSLTKSLT